jgi:hypothetical protein
MDRRTFLSKLSASAIVASHFVQAKDRQTRPPAANLFFNCKPANDLYRVVENYWPGLPRFENVEDTLQRADAGSGVLLLADYYPNVGITITSRHLDIASQKSLRLYVEYPASFPGLDISAPRETQWERTVVASNAFGEQLPKLRILAIHGCRFAIVQAAASHLVLARIAGFDTAVYGLPDVTYPILFQHPNVNALVATTKLSQFVTARYAPNDAWGSVWRMILRWLDPELAASNFAWTATVRPSYARDTNLPSDGMHAAVISGIDWHTKARLLVHPSWEREYEKYGNADFPIGPRPDPNWPCGDGELGLLEGFDSKISFDGDQKVRWWLRTDCNGESSLAFALREKVDGDKRSQKIATNLLDWVYFNSGLMHDDPSKANFGLLGWAPNEKGTYYQDNDVKAILGCLGTAGVLNSDRWDKALLKNILGNFRTTGTNGFRGQFIEDKELQERGWQNYWRGSSLHYSAHFEAWIWAAYLWLYDKTHFAPLLHRSKTGIQRMMEVYPTQWRWTNGLQQERGRMLLTLAWLIRVQDTPEHRKWLKQIADDLLADQVESGAIRERMGEIKMGQMAPPASNEAYGTAEAPLIQQNGDPVADLLYTCNFALLGLHEAAAATGNSRYQRAEEKLIEFLLRVQVKSDTHPELDGAWFRAFDFERWDYWASNSDWGWGAWSIECGWTQGWINTVLSLKILKLNLWDLSKNSRIARYMDEIRPLMIPDKELVLSSDRNNPAEC